MKRNLPPLKSLRAFESAARLLSITQAAYELNVTHSAISQQVKILEEFFARPLFFREKSKISLTEDGEKLLPVASMLLDRLADVTEEILNTDRGTGLTINLTAAFATHWLVPRLGDFQHSYPDIHLRLMPSARFSEYDRMEFDVAIRWGEIDDPTIESVELFEVDAFPACAPDLINGKKPIRKPEDLYHHSLIHDDDGSAWKEWFAAAQIPYPGDDKSHFFADSSLALQAAVNGQGVIAAGSILAHGDLEARRLVVPFDIILRNRNAYFLSYRKQKEKSVALQHFIHWITGQIKGFNKGKLAPDQYVVDLNEM